MNIDEKNVASSGIAALLASSDPDRITSEDVLKLYMQIQKEETLTKYKLPEHPSSDGYFHTAVRDRSRKSGQRQFKAKTITELKDKIYAWEQGRSQTLAPSHTFRDVFEAVINEKLTLVKDPQKRISVQNTVGRMRSEYKRFFSETAFESKPIHLLTKRDIEDILLRNLKKYGLRKKGFQSLKNILSSVFGYAFNEYWIRENPYLRINFHRYKDMLLMDASVERRVHTPKEIERILCALHRRQNLRPGYIPAYALEFQFLCGLRRGEVPPLTWDDVTDTVYIHREQLTEKKHDLTPERDVIVDHSKTWKNRRFPVTEEAAVLIERIKAAHSVGHWNSPFLFPAKTENGCITNNTLYNLYRRICREQDIPISREFQKGPHSFRRNRITEVVNAPGGSFDLAAELFGNSPQVAKSHYFTGLDLEKAKRILEEASGQKR